MSFLFSKNKNGIELAKDVVSIVNKKIKRVYWTNEEIDKFFARRSANEIIQSETTCFMNPCLDLTLVSASIMYSNNIKHRFIIEEHLPTKDFNFGRLHFALEFQHKNKDYFLNYKKENEVYILEGHYNGREDIPRTQIRRILGKMMYPENTLHKNLGYDNLEELIKGKFLGYSLKSNLDRLKQDNSIENYEDYKKRNGEEFNIITKLQNQL